MKLGKHYEVVEVLRGGMGEVFICDYVGGDDAPEQRTRVALKTFQQQFFFDNAVRNAFVREASVWLRLTGLPYIMPVFGIEQIERRPFIRMFAVERQNGVRTLADLIARVQLSPLDALGFAFQIALAMRQAAARVPELVHGDLKPANVLLMNGKAFVSDFGLAHAAALGRADSRLVGTLAYRAPELAVEGAAPAVSSDVYAFGASLAEMLGDEDGNDAAGAAAMALARSCTDAEPLARPRDFADVVERLSGILEKHDPVAHLMLMMDAAQYQQMFREPEAARLSVERIRSLIELGETQQALDELDAIPRGEYTPELWLRRAMALSIANRPEEAIEVLGPLLENESELEPESRVLARSEYALCLKRLDRFDEARRIYEQLLLEVDDEHLPIVVVNLSTVHLEQHNDEEAVRLLEPFVRKHPDCTEAWANLGRAYMGVGRYENSEKAFGRALRRDPGAGLVRVWLAGLYMDHLRRIPEAWAALDAAFDAGHESREWLVRFLACSLLLNREDTLAGLKQALDNNFEKELADSMVSEAVEMAKRIAGNENGGDAAATSPVETGPTPPEPMPAATEPARPSEASERRPGIPFINFRYYTTGDFTFDFYDDPQKPDFLDDFVREWRRAMRDPHVQMSGASLRGSPFYFTRCPQCGVHVVTNRELGYKLDCRMCDTRFFTSALDEPSLSELTARMAEVTGVAESDVPLGDVHALLVQTANDEEQARAEQICREAGMTLLPRDELLAIAVLRQAVEHGVCGLARPWSVWTMPAEQRRWAPTATPPNVGRVVSALQEAVPGVRSMSSTFAAETLEALRGSATEAIARDEQEIREKLRRHDASAEEMRRLANILAQRQELDEAERIARAALAADDASADGWQILGWIFARAGRFAAARAPLERSLALDPTRALNWRMLAACCHRSGDPQRAAEAELRGIAIMGDAEPPFPVE